MKRSVSPQTVLEADTPNKKRKGHGFFSVLKRAFSGLSDDQENVNEAANYISQDPFPTNFTSRKRKQSVVESLKAMSLQIPRSSSMVGLANYQTLRNSIQSEKEAISGDLEQRRMSIVVGEEDYLLKEQSPTLNIVPRNQILPTDPNEMELESDAGSPIIIEHEFAPLYKDGEGNLVRPPFINLDPRERYHLLQLKKSIEASDFLQSRLKYMIDPDETTSVTKPNNKVDSSTQTYNKDFLVKSLNFDAVRTKLALANRKNRRTKKGRGLFSGEFYYEPIKTKPEAQTESADGKLTGYLGKLSLPAFKTTSKSSGPKPFPDDDSAQSLTQRQKSTSQRAGLEESIRTGQAKDAVLDEDYVRKTEKISSIIKLKDQPATKKKPSVGPGSGFNFEIKKKDFGSILQTRKEDEELVQKSSTPILPELSSKPQLTEKPSKAVEGSVSTSLFGDAAKSSSKDESRAPKPAFSFNTSKSSDQDRNLDAKLDAKAELSKPTSLFGKPKSETPKAAFNFGSKPSEPEKESTATKPLFSFGAKPSATDAPKPAFSFGKPTTADLGEQKKLPSFGTGATPSTSASSSEGLSSRKQAETPELAAKENETPKFSFGGKKEEPKFSFGDQKETPKFSFGEKKVAPQFSFGEKKDTPLSFGEKKNAPNVSFGDKTDTPSTSFGKIGSKPSTSSFSFGEKKSETPAFSFGSKTETKPTTQDGSVANANNEESEAPKTPATSVSFNLSAPTQQQPPSVENKDSLLRVKRVRDDESATKRPLLGLGSAFGSKSTTEIPKTLFSKTGPTPAFTLSSEDGKKDNSEPPNFTFGQLPGNKAATPTPAFSFGNKDAPSFNFGQNTGNTAKDTASVFSFSSKETTPKPQTEESGVSKPAFSFGNPASNGTPAPFSLGNTPATEPAAEVKSSFSFGNSATADPALIFGGGGGAPAPAFNFSAPSSKPAGSPFGNSPAPFGAGPSTPFNFGGNSNTLAAPTPLSGAFGAATGVSTTSTPGIGQNLQMPNPASVFGGGGGQTPGFSFSNTGNFNSAPGSFGLASRENTPPVFGGNPPMGQAPGQPFTPPLAKQGRKIAQMRPRKRF